MSRETLQVGSKLTSLLIPTNLKNGMVVTDLQNQHPEVMVYIWAIALKGMGLTQYLVADTYWAFIIVLKNRYDHDNLD